MNSSDYRSPSVSDDEATRIIPGRGGRAVLVPGTVLGNTYVIETLLARGGMGEVYRARHRELGTEHAIKIVLPIFANDPKITQLFREEARKLGRLNSDAIVDYQGFLRDENGLLYLVTEFVDGPSLGQIVRQRRLEPNEVMRLRDRLAHGLAAAHAVGIVHRDVSLDNILVPDSDVDRAKLIDFGIAKWADALSPMTVIDDNFVGKYSYASPEQLGLFGGRVDFRSDIYSLGLVLAAAAIGFGKKLEMGSSAAAMIAARQKVPDLSEVPASLRPIIEPMLQPRPDDRPASMLALLNSADQVRVARTQLWSSLNSARWRFASLPLAALLALAVVGLGAVALLHMMTPTSPPSVEELRRRLAPAIALYHCSSLDYAIDSSRAVRVSGYVASRADIDQLRRAIDGIGGIAKIDFAARLRPWPFCEVAKVLAPLINQKPQSPATLSLSSENSAVRAGAPMIIDVRAPSFDGYLYVDYFDSEGHVAHLFPNQQDRLNFRPALNHLVLGKPPSLGRWTFAGKPGEQLLTLVATAEPLFHVSRPAIENAKDYLPDWAKAIGSLSGENKTAAILFFNEIPLTIEPQLI